MQLEGRIVAITGAGSGIGRALALTFAEYGAIPILIGRSEKKLRETEAQLPSGTLAWCCAADITTPHGRQSVLQACRASGQLDILINNAGLVPSGLLDDLSDADLEQTAATNIVAPIALTRDLLPLLRRSDRAWIVNVGHPHFSAYCATKFGLRGFSDAIRRELARDKIGVTYAAPRATRTAATDGMATLVSGYHMKLDDPLVVARRIVAAVEAESTTVFPGATERLLIFIQHFFPALIDFGLRRQAAAILDGQG
jgi:short-subunit dehydrogenase